MSEVVVGAKGCKSSYVANPCNIYVGSDHRARGYEETANKEAKEKQGEEQEILRDHC